MRPDNKKIAALAMLESGRATVSEVARLVGTSRQLVQHWTVYGIEHKGPPWPRGRTARLDLDVKAARAGLLAKQWADEIGKLEAEDREGERAWRAELKALQAKPAKPKVKARVNSRRARK